ncbi:MsnO8 family LLM class oxidoreductase [Spirillospora sp. NPDC050679]
MSASPASVRFSVLDRSRTRAGEDPASALRATVAFAREIEDLGYERFWVSEHHSLPGVAGSAPTVLAAAVAGATSRIRVGTGGVMLPNHRPLVVAEQFGVLESLYPGRIDMGLGRSLAFTGGVRRALGVTDVEDFPERVRELLGYFGGGRDGVHAWPAEGLRVPAFLLATGAGAGLAAELGLPLVIAPARGEARMVEAIERYRAEFRGERPYVVVSEAVVVADSAREARRLLMPEAWSNAYARTRGDFPVLIPPEEIDAIDMSARERRIFEESMDGQIAGTEDEVAEALEGLVERTGADEVLVHTSTWDREARLESHRRLARLVGLTSEVLRAAG